MTKFDHTTLIASSDDESTLLTIVSTGPMIVEACMRGTTDGLIQIEWFDIGTNTEFDMAFLVAPLECQSLGVNVGDRIEFRANPLFEDIVVASLNIRTTPSGIITIQSIDVPEP